jgi:hypothetical protein
MELMDHETAIRTKSSERYAIGDLSSSERDEFEEHFSDCTQCMDDVSLASTFAANAKAVFRERAYAKPAPRSTFLQGLFARPLAAFAAVAFAAVIVYQNMVVIPETKAPRSAIASVRLDGETRAAVPQVKAADALRVQMPFDWPAGSAKASREPNGSRELNGLAELKVFVELMDTLGNPVSKGAVAAPGPNQPLELYFPVRLNPGRYTVVVRADKAGQEIARSAFEVTALDAKTP